MSSLLSHFYLKLGGSDAPEDLMQDLGNVEVDDSLHIPDMFTLRVRDPQFKWADSPLLAIGQEVVILAAASGPGQPEAQRLLVGEITSVEPDYPYGGMPALIVRGYDRAHRLHRGKKTRTFLQMTDSDIVTRIAREYGLRPEVDTTTEVHEYILQSNQTDFEFILERARRIGFNFLVDDRALVFKKPSSLPSEAVELVYGVTLREFRPRMSTGSQFKEVVVKAWDAVNKREIIGRAGPDGAGGAGGSGGPLGGLAEAAGGALGSAASAAANQLQALAEQAVGFASEAVAAEVARGRGMVGEAMAALPPEARGPAEQALQAGIRQGLELASEYLGAKAAGAIAAIATGNPADIAQVGLELGSKVVEKAFGEAGSLIVTQHPVSSQAEADALAKSIFAELTSGNLQAEGVAVGNPKLTAGCKVRLVALGPRFSGEYFVGHTRHIYDAEEGYLTEFTISGRNADTFVDLLFGGAGANPGLTGNGAPAGVVVGIVTNNKDPEERGRVKVMFPWLSANEESNWARVASPMAGAERGLFILPEVNDEVLVVFEQGDVNRPYVLGCLWNGVDKPPLSTDAAVDGEGKVIRRTLKTRAGHMITLDDSDNSSGIQIVDKTGKNRIVIDSQKDKLEIEIEGDVSLKARGKIAIQAENDVRIEARGSLALKAAASMDIEAGGQVKIRGATIELN